MLFRAWAVVLAAGYAIVLHLAYRHHISPAFQYLGYSYDALTAVAVFACLVVAVLPICITPLYLQAPSQIFFWFLYIVVYVPAAVVLPHLSILKGVDIVLLVSLLLIFISLVNVIHRLPRLRHPFSPLSPAAFWALFSCIYLGLLTTVIWAFGLDIDIRPSLADVYDVRFDFREKAGDLPRFISYGLPWFAIFNSFLIALGAVRKNVALIVLGFVGQGYIFGITGLKSALFSGFLILACVILSARARAFGAWVLGAALAAVTLGWLLDEISGGVLFSAMFTRRLLVTPILLTAHYVDVFSEIGHVYLSHSVLSPFLTYPHDLPPPYMIGKFYLGNVQASANANIFADAYANFGFAGIPLFGALLLIALWVADSLCHGRDLRLATGALVYVAFVVTNSAFLTVVLTHGLWLALMLLVLYPHPPAAYRPAGSLVGERR